jgi:hypothetical protein
MVELYRQVKLIRPPQLSGNRTRSHLVAKQELGEGNDKFSLTKYLVHT